MDVLCNLAIDNRCVDLSLVLPHPEVSSAGAPPVVPIGAYLQRTGRRRGGGTIELRGNSLVLNGFWHHVPRVADGAGVAPM